MALKRSQNAEKMLDEAFLVYHTLRVHDAERDDDALTALRDFHQEAVKQQRKHLLTALHAASMNSDAPETKTSIVAHLRVVRHKLNSTLQGG